MILFVGLGNPEQKYQGNRHNAGFMAVDAIAGRHDFGPERQKFRGLLREGRLGHEKVLILKPQTFYNESGRAVSEAAQFYKLAPEDVIVFHDEIDLAPGKLRVKAGGGLAGNNGLKSIAAQFSPDVWRVRIGVGHPGDKRAVTAHVLKDFAKEEQESWVADLLDGIAKAAPALVPLDADGTAKFASQAQQGLAPAKEKAKKARPAPAAPSTGPLSEAASDAPKGPFGALKGLLRPKG